MIFIQREGVAIAAALVLLFSFTLQASAQTTGVTPGSNISPDQQILIKVGTKGTIVKTLQSNLKEIGIYEGKISGTYDKKTQQAVKDLYLVFGQEETTNWTAAMQGYIDGVLMEVREMPSTEQALLKKQLKEMVRYYREESPLPHVNEPSEEDKKKKEFIHKRYKALKTEFKKSQIAYGYTGGMISIGFIDTPEEVGKPLPGKMKNILLGYSPTDDRAAWHTYWNAKTQAIKGKRIKIVLPDEEIFTQSYSCDGPYQDCYLYVKNKAPDTEAFYAKVYMDGVLLNDEYTEEQQEVAKRGQSALFYRGVLNNKFNDLRIRFSTPQKVTAAYASDTVYLTLKHQQKIPTGVDSGTFMSEMVIRLKGITLHQGNYDKVQKYLTSKVQNRMVQVVIPTLDEIVAKNPGYDDSTDQIYIDAQVYINKASLNDILNKL